MFKIDKDVTPKDYDEYYGRVGNLKDERVTEIVSLCPDVETILDLGGGTGNVSEQLKGQITIVDWSNKAAEFVGPNIKYIKQDIIDYLGETKDTFDLVILADVIEEMKESQTKAVIDGVNRIAQKFFVLSTPTHENYITMSTHQVIYTKQELIDMLPDWKIVREIRYPDRIMALFERK